MMLGSSKRGSFHPDQRNRTTLVETVNTLVEMKLSSFRIKFRQDFGSRGRFREFNYLNYYRYLRDNSAPVDRAKGSAAGDIRPILNQWATASTRPAAPPSAAGNRHAFARVADAPLNRARDGSWSISRSDRDDLEKEELHKSLNRLPLLIDQSIPPDRKRL